MECWTVAQSREWMRVRFPADTTFDESTNLPRLSNVGYYATAFALPPDSGRKVYLANLLYALCSEGRRVLIYLQNWDIFPSSGHLPLLRRLREALGERRTLELSPGHVFHEGERDDAVSVLVLTAEFFWDCLVVGDSGSHAAYLSHDGYCEIFSREAPMTGWVTDQFPEVELW